MAGFSALSAGLALMAYCVLWIGIGWEGGGNGALMAAVTAAFFAAQDDPAPRMLSFLTWAVVASVVAGICLFGIFPAIHDLPMPMPMPMLLPIGALLHRPKTTRIALALMVHLTARLSLQNTYNPDIQSFVNAAVAMVLCIGFTVVLRRLFHKETAQTARANASPPALIHRRFVVQPIAALVGQKDHVHHQRHRNHRRGVNHELAHMAGLQ